MLCRTFCVILLPSSGQWVELEDAQLLVAAACLCDACGPRYGLLARRQFEHGKAAVEWGCPRVAACSDRAVGRDECWRHIFVDAAAEDVDAGGLCFVDHGMCVAADRFPFAVGHDHRRAGERDQVLGHGAPPFESMVVMKRVCGPSGCALPAPHG